MAESNGDGRVESTILDIKCFNGGIRGAFLCNVQHKYAFVLIAESGRTRGEGELEGAIVVDVKL
jgi:hypothetical protein